MISLFNGCSHTEGCNGITPNETWSNIVLKSISKNSIFLHLCSTSEVGTDEYIFQHLNNLELEYNSDIGISVAKAGKGNDAICFETINYVEFLKQIDKKPEYVFIQWSGPTRKIVQTFDGQTQWLNPFNCASNPNEPGFHPNWEPVGSSLTLTYYFILQTYLEKNNIKYVFIDYPGLENRMYNSYLKKSINYNKVISGTGDIPCKEFEFDTHNKHNKQILLNYFVENNLNSDIDGHPNREGYRYLGKKVCDVLGIDLIDSHKWDMIIESEELNWTSHSDKFYTKLYETKKLV